MYHKIEKHFRNRRFYKNYNNIENVILHFKKIRDTYNSFRNKYKLLSFNGVLKYKKYDKHDHKLISCIKILKTLAF